MRPTGGPQHSERAHPGTERSLPAAWPRPSPLRLGRGVVVLAGAPVPHGWAGAEVVAVDEPALLAPAGVVARLFAAWSARRPVVVALGVDPACFRAPESIAGEPWTHTPLTEPWFDRLHFLVWANNYDARAGALVWWWSAKAARASRVPRRSRPRSARTATSASPTARAVWIDGGPRRPCEDGELIIHAESVELGASHARPAEPAAARRRSPTTSSPPSATAPARRESSPPPAPARPACSPNGCVTSSRTGASSATGVLAVAYNKQAQLEMERRTTRRSDAPRCRPHAQLARAVGGHTSTAAGPPPVLDERDVRRLVDALLPGRRQRRANTDPIGPYLEGAGVDPPRPARSRRRGGRARRRARPRRAVPRLPHRPAPSAAPSTSTSRSTPRSRRCSATARSAARCNAPAATCSSTSSRTSPRPTSCCCACWRCPASTCSASATTTSASMATPTPTPASSSTTPPCSPVPASTPCT